ncbi:MAG TPA: sugar phosphate isomerase/epimerase family protein [Chloroflexota bacterium]|nr:sugar phosphate isomerase/epimerase family protein [Chloroflexota bacterium]
MHNVADHATRFVFAGPASWPLERSIEWAASHGFTRVDFNADAPANYPGTFTPDRQARIRNLVTQHQITLGLHTLSAVNMAEITPVLHAAIDEYLRQNFDLIQSLGGSYVICHGGFHFSSDREVRLATAVARMQRAARLAEERDLDIYFENHNKEPNDAEIHYMPRDVVETRRFFDAVQSPRFKWACNVAHANLVPDGIDGFLNAFGVERIGQVRLNDNRGIYEEHLLPGQGNIDFRYVFHRLTELGYHGPFTLDFGGPAERVAWRDTFAKWLAEI